MPWPTPQDYNEAIQNPRSVFVDGELRSGRPEVDGLGLPRPRSGSFACVYKIECPGRAWAAKCFTTEVNDQQERYEAIDRHLAQARLPYTVAFGYQPQGLRVKGREYPLLKMEWVRGVSLSAFIGSNLSNPEVLGALAEKWMEMLKALQQAEIAHGDLQDRNVLVVGGDLRLVDYDGMFVPALAGRFSNEVGQRNFQHPYRTNIDYGPYLDNFSGWVVYASLVALSDRPKLWNRYQGGDECLLFRRADFEHPETSAVLRDLNQSTSGNVRILGEFIARLSALSVLDVPALDVVHGATAGDAAVPAGGGAAGEWWKDHTGEKPTKEQTGGAAAAGPDVGWIVQEVTGPVERAKFQNSFKGIRVVAGSSFAAVLVTGFAAGLPAIAFLGLSLSVLVALALYCFSRYRDDPSLVEYRLFKKALAELVREVESKRNQRKILEGARTEVVAGMTAAQTDWNNRRRQVEAELQEEMGNLQGRLTSVLRLLDERRRSIAAQEASELRALQAGLSDRIAGLERDIAGLVTKENSEKEASLQSLRRVFMDSWMRGYPIASSYLSGIGPGNAARLAEHNFVTAADLDRYGLTSVPGIGPKRADALRGWRDRIRAKGEARAPASLPRAEAARIEGNFQNERSRRVEEKRGLEEQLQTRAQFIRQQHALERVGVDKDDRAHRDANARETAGLRQRYAARVTQLDKDMQARRAKDQATVAEMTQKLRDFDKSFSVLQWNCAKKEREGAKYDRLGFGDFLRSATG
jgi:hypothetical protein